MPLLTVGLLFIFGHLSRVHLTTLKIHTISQTSPNFEQRTSPEVVNYNGNKATSHENPIPVCISRDGACASWALPGGLGFQGKAKEWAVTGGLGPSGLRLCINDHSSKHLEHTQTETK